MKAATTSMFHSEISPASRQRSASRRSMSSSRRSIRGRGSCHGRKRRTWVGRHDWPVGELRFGRGTGALAGEPRGGGRDPAGAGLHGLRDRLRGQVLDGLPVGGALRRARAGARDRPLGARADRRLHGPRRTWQKAQHGRRDARPLGGDREDRRRRARRLPSRASCSAGRARRRSTRSSSSSGSCASGSSRRIARCRSGSR